MKVRLADLIQTATIQKQYKKLNDRAANDATAAVATTASLGPSEAHGRSDN